MRLKRLDLQGYKTFATKQDFVFDEGITAIVGPNGSGKSNIADALRWVLGEQSYSQLRGKRTTDMIFAGSQTRARAGMAQAILTLDNSNGWLPIDYSEVEIGRRAYRSGENEYLLNGQKVRLRDITDLLASSGLAERHYTIIGQGLVDQALSLRADERRALFEEAAGITHYKTRRAEALRRLEETERNLLRIQDILSEIRPRLHSLRQQASRALNYEQVATDLRHLLRHYYGYQWAQARRRARQARETATADEAAWQQSRQRLRGQQEQIDQLRQRLAAWQQEERAQVRARESLRDQAESARHQAIILKERRNLLQAQLAEVEKDLAASEGRVETSRQALASAVAELELAQAALERERAIQAQASAQWASRQEEVARLQAEVAARQKARQESQQRWAQAEGELAQLLERMQEVEALELGPATLEAAATAVAEAGAAVRQAEEAYQQESARREAQAQQRQEWQAQLKALRQPQAQEQKALAQLEKDIGRLEARRDLLDQLRRKGLPPAEQATVLGQFAGMVTLPPAFAPGLAAALQERLAALLVAGEEQLWSLLDGKGSSLAAVALDQVQPPPPLPLPSHPAVVGWASELATAPAHLAPLVRLLLGRVLLVQERQAAFALARVLPPGAMAVTPDGFVAHAGGLVTWSSPEEGQRALAREEEWGQAVARLEEKRQERAQRVALAASRQREIDQAQQALEQLEEAGRDLNRAVQEAGNRLAQAQRQWDRAQQQQRQLAQRQASLAAEKEKLAARLEGKRQQIRQQQAAVAAAVQALEEAQAQLQALPVAELAQQAEHRRQRLEAEETIVAGRRAVVDSRQAALEQGEKLWQRSVQRQGELERQLEALDLAAAEAEEAACRARLEAADAALAPLQAELRAGLERLAGLERGIAGIQREAHELESRHTQAQIALSQQQGQLEGLRERIYNDLGIVSLDVANGEAGQAPLPLAEVVETLPAVDRLSPDIEDEIQKQRAQLRRMGAINAEAPQEYEETQRRYQFLTQQVDDLQATEKQLRQVIAQLDDLTSQAFAGTVERVNAVFGEMFQRLFGGGSARLLLTEPDDLTISGVDIVARLPSRRQQGLGLLSGGERSLTAAALVFSLLKVSPTPFCVMDEVDAMLDEANVNRFVEAVRELSQQTQFILITHNRGTVQAARTVYGISMGADSASRVISIRPDALVGD